MRSFIRLNLFTLFKIIITFVSTSTAQASLIKGYRYSVFTGVIKSRAQFKSSNGADQINVPLAIPNGGVGFELRFKIFTLEVDGVLVKHQFQLIDSALAKISKLYSWYGLQVPVLARIHIGQYFSLGAGIYGEYALGSINAQSSNPVEVPNRTLDYYEFGLRRWDYGWLVDVSFNRGLIKKIGLGLRADGRVTQGLHELSTLPGRSRTLADYQFFVGLTLGKTHD